MEIASIHKELVKPAKFELSAVCVELSLYYDVFICVVWGADFYTL